MHSASRLVSGGRRSAVELPAAHCVLALRGYRCVRARRTAARYGQRKPPRSTLNRMCAPNRGDAVSSGLARVVTRRSPTACSRTAILDHVLALFSLRNRRSSSFYATERVFRLIKETRARAVRALRRSVSQPLSCRGLAASSRRRPRARPFAAPGQPPVHLPGAPHP